jgi:hypothetical protein
VPNQGGDRQFRKVRSLARLAKLCCRVCGVMSATSSPNLATRFQMSGSLTSSRRPARCSGSETGLVLRILETSSRQLRTLKMGLETDRQLRVKLLKILASRTIFELVLPPSKGITYHSLSFAVMRSSRKNPKFLNSAIRCHPLSFAPMDRTLRDTGIWHAKYARVLRRAQPA